MIAQRMMTKEEWLEMCVLKQAISDLPSSVSTDKMERFTELFVRSIDGADDRHPSQRQM